jgi:hypothetical protein
MSKAYPNHKWVAFTSKMGRTEAGVYERFVHIVGDAAYVLPKSDGNVADILPAANVFEKKADALAYMAGTGVEKWVVDAGGRGEPVTLFWGRVRYFMTKRWGHYDRCHSAVRISDGKVFQGHNLRTFDRKKDAEKAHAATWKDRHANLAHDLKEKIDEMAAMLECRPRSRKAKR